MLILPRWGSLVLLCTCSMSVLGQAPPATSLPAPLESPLAQSSYGIGIQFGQNLMQGGLDGELVDLAAMMAGIRDALGEQEPRVSQEQFQAAMQQVQELARSKMQKKMELLAEKNRREGPAFLKRYQALAGVKSLPSGVLYRVRKSGTGPSPTAADTVRTHYEGKLVDGTKFDSSYDRGEPAVFPVQGVIDGWTQVLQQMKVGDQWEIVIPSELAYGKQGSPPVIGPDSVLVFSIELLGIEPPQPDQQQRPVP